MNNDFTSIEKLMELGLGLSIAQQMVATMNHTMGNMMVPGVSVTPPAVNPVGYYAVVNEALIGPMNETELSILIDKGSVAENTFIWFSGMTGWKYAKDIPQVYKLILLKK